MGSLPPAPPGKPYRKVASYIRTQKDEKIKYRPSYNILITIRRKLESLLIPDQEGFRTKSITKGKWVFPDDNGVRK